MTHKLTTFAAALGLAAALTGAPRAARAQDHLVIPLSHPSQPAALKVSLLMGSITVKAYDGRDIVVDASGGDGDVRLNGRRQRPAPPEAEGMHLLTTAPGLDAQEDNNQVRISSSTLLGGANLTIQVPAHTSLNLHTVNGGGIDVEGVTGDISVDSLNGVVTLRHVGGSIVAHALNGRIEATVVSLDTSKPSSFSSLNGVIDLTLPATVHATLNLKTDQGDIYMDDGFNFQRSSAGASAPADDGSGYANHSYKIRLDRSVSGTINGGGANIRVENFNGNIYIRKAH